MTRASPPSRSDRTRLALLEAGLDLFGHSGYEATSTRDIARAAGVNQALIGYHFGGKRGLYLAVFETIVDQMRSQLLPVAAQVTRQLEEAPAQPVARREASLDLMLTIFDAYMDMIGGGAASGWVRLILREQQDPTDAFQLIYDNIFSHMLALLSRLVAAVSGLEQSSEACRVRTLMLVGQVLVFFVARGTTSQYLAWENYNPDNIAAIKQQMRQLLATQFAQGVTAV